MKSNGKNKKSRREFLKKTALGAAAAGAANLAASAKGNQPETLTQSIISGTPET